MKKLLTTLLISITLSSLHAEEIKFEHETKEQWVNSINFDANLNPTGELSDVREQEFFLNFMIEYNRMWSPGLTANFDINVPGEFYQQSDRLFAFDLFPPTEGFKGWEAYSKELVSIVNRSSYFSLVFETSHFRYSRNENVVWMSATFTANGITQDGYKYQSPARQTVVLELIGDRWLIAHEHISTPYIPN